MIEHTSVHTVLLRYYNKKQSLPTRPHRWQVAGQGDTYLHMYMYKHKSLPTKPHRWQIAGQGDTYMYIQTQIPAYKTAQMADRRSGRYIHVHTNTNPCLQDRTDGRSPVREIHTYKHKSLPTRPHRWQIAGQGDTYSRESLIRTSVIRTRRLTERAVRATPPLLRSPRVYSVRSNWTHYVLYSTCAINPRWLLVLVLRPLERKGRELF